MTRDRMGVKRNELISDLVSLAERTLQAYDIPVDVSVVVANMLGDRLADHWGGQNISFPKDYRWSLARRSLEIYEQFDGTNFDSLAQKYKMTERAMRKLIARVRERLQSNAQHDLFNAHQPR